MTKHYVEFFYTSRIPVGPEEEEIAERSYNLVKVPKGAIGYRFFDREENIVDGKPVESYRYNYSPYLYWGMPLTQKDVRKMYGRMSPFYKFMKEKEYDRAVLTDDNNIFFVEDEDRILTIL